jgi:hypothetical protein
MQRRKVSQISNHFGTFNLMYYPTPRTKCSQGRKLLSCRRYDISLHTPDVDSFDFATLLLGHIIYVSGFTRAKEENKKHRATSAAGFMEILPHFSSSCRRFHKSSFTYAPHICTILMPEDFKQSLTPFSQAHSHLPSLVRHFIPYYEHHTAFRT